MTTTIASTGGTITPTLLLMLNERARSGNILHDIKGRASPDASLYPAGLRRGRIELGFSGASANTLSAAAFNALRQPRVFTLTDSDEPTVNMTFVLDEDTDIEREIEPETRAAWTVSFGFREITP